ncbi:uncharacterized protein K452DRAFT_313087 [Aplosporella prunicola CBS 121167]|uniref:Fucose-specific lectin n=1 Tax=Aplosporella prunicola CBS 121167 TaxID=1176127 RepID=A0A6A6B1A9_9PEZI|nr:uncharacterized protein K452DRAFT_313087 [Aplosporella prunicola CBS 121167]KAF2136521.1 hypothetical protein K452DRAFT_313087 [Aplosporella prunicola CBS 121167]
MSETRESAYSTLELDRRQMGDGLPEVLPNTDAPEAFNTGEKETAKNANKLPVEKSPVEKRVPNICGMRRRLFWILLVVALLIVAGAVIGAVFGTARNKRSKSPSHGDIHQSPKNGTEIYKRGISRNSQLATANYTDKLGIDHSQLYYQDNSLQIWSADWNSSASNWTLYEVLSHDNKTIIPKDGTPIATANYWRPELGNTDYRCLFVDNENFVRIFFIIRGATSDPWAIWPAIDRVMQVSENSSLVHYMRQCDGCDNSDFTSYESQAGDLIIHYPFSNGDGGDVTGKLQPNGIVIDKYTAMAVAPLPARSSKTASVAMYLVSGGLLAEIYGMWGQTWVVSDLISTRQYSVDNGAQLAAITQPTGADFKKQVLITKADGGVKMAYMDGSDWCYQDNVDGMEKVLPLSPIAANQLGRVYALEDGPQVVEWTMINGSVPTFKRVGAVDTTGGRSS